MGRTEKGKEGGEREASEKGIRSLSFLFLFLFFLTRRFRRERREKKREEVEESEGAREECQILNQAKTAFTHTREKRENKTEEIFVAREKKVRAESIRLIRKSVMRRPTKLFNALKILTHSPTWEVIALLHGK